MVSSDNATTPSSFEDSFDAAAAGLADSILGIGSAGRCGMLADPVVRAALAGDGVASTALVTLLRQIADKLADRHRRALAAQDADRVRPSSLIAAS